MATAAAMDTDPVATGTGLVSELVVVDNALSEFAGRSTVYADPIIDEISKIDPVCADRLRQVTSTLPGNPALLHARDAIDVLLDLRLALS